MTEEQKKKCEEIYLHFSIISIVPISYQKNLYKDALIKSVISLAKVFNRDITEKEAKEIIDNNIGKNIMNSVISSIPILRNQSYKDIFWKIANYFDEEQKKKIEKIINSSEEKYKKSLEELLDNFHEGYVPSALLFHYGNMDTIFYYYNPISMLFGGMVPLSFILSQMEGVENEFFEFLGDSKDKTAEIIIDATVYLSEIFNKNITKEEAEKLLFIKNDTKEEKFGTAYLGKFCVFTEEFRKIIEEYEEDKYGIERVISAIANYFDNGNKEANKINKINKINNVVETTAKEKIMSNNDELTLNLLILGKTGVGKSSLLNALVGEEKEPTAVGKPQTKKGIFPHEVEIDGKKVIIHDSWGLEVGADKEWEKIINNALNEKGIDKDIKDWFHSVTYCIQAGGDRVEDFDLKMIKQFIDEKYNVIIALTKSDQIGKAKRERFIKEIEKAIKIKIITYNALSKSNIIDEVKEEFIKEIEAKIGKIEEIGFDQIDELKSDNSMITTQSFGILPLRNPKYNKVIELMKSNQIMEAKIDKFIIELEKEIKEATKIYITVIPISADPEQLDNMTEKPKPYGLEEYKAAILLSWEKIFIDRIPLHIIEKLKKDIENAKKSVPNRKPKDDDDLKVLAKDIQDYFNNILNEKLQNHIKENFEKYYKINEEIININTNIDISNFYSRKSIDPDTYIYDLIGFNLVYIFEHIKDLFKYLYNRIKTQENIDEFINKTYEETKKYISEKKFEDNIRKSIIDTFNNIEKENLKNKN